MHTMHPQKNICIHIVQYYIHTQEYECMVDDDFVFIDVCVIVMICRYRGVTFYAQGSFINKLVQT